ncbi:hypothetical protein [Nocardioides sp.]|uniref:hypothetical protein n=1 Tax=Nocardioides sp. TaxID=35761 RepID=UPI0027348E67|nr:hypothetical protein [Nocardioides sp.]MDP3891326.1 hypothetical protein [Nocardioides sp.]
MDTHDFIAEQATRTSQRSLSPDPAQRRGRGLIRALWSGVRQIAWGIDAHSRVWHGIDVPPDHGARSSIDRRPGSSAVREPLHPGAEPRPCGD